MKLTWISLVLFVVAFGCSASAQLGEALRSMLSVQQPPATGNAAPDFTLTTLDGDQIALSDFRGQVVVLNFWASWCPPCELEAPILESFWQTYKDQGVTVIGIDYADNEQRAESYITDQELTYPNGSDPQGQLLDAFHVDGIPETIIVDQQGNIAYHFVGTITEQELIESVEQLLMQS